MNFQTAANEGDYRQIMEMTRKIGKLNVDIGNIKDCLTLAELQKIKNIIGKFGPKLNTLRLSGSGGMSALDVCEMFAMIPLVESLSLYKYMSSTRKRSDASTAKRNSTCVI
jgi:hypothetical protein